MILTLSEGPHCSPIFTFNANYSLWNANLLLSGWLLRLAQSLVADPVAPARGLCGRGQVSWERCGSLEQFDNPACTSLTQPPFFSRLAHSQLIRRGKSCEGACRSRRIARVMFWLFLRCDALAVGETFILFSLFDLRRQATKMVSIRWDMSVINEWGVLWLQYKSDDH